MSAETQPTVTQLAQLERLLEQESEEEVKAPKVRKKIKGMWHDPRLTKVTRTREQILRARKQDRQNRKAGRR